MQYIIKHKLNDKSMATWTRCSKEAFLELCTDIINDMISTGATSFEIVIDSDSNKNKEN